MGMAGSTAKITKFFEKAVGRVSRSTGGRDPSVDGNAAGGTRPSGGLVSLLAFRVPCLLQFARVMMFLGLRFGVSCFRVRYSLAISCLLVRCVIRLGPNYIKFANKLGFMGPVLLVA